MKENNKQELSYFRLKLRSYISEHHPERLKDTEFITARADMALTAYCDAVAQGFMHPEAESMASEVLYQGLHFSKYDTLVSVLENEFEKELPMPLTERLAPILLSNKAIQATFDKFGLTDILASDEQYDRLYTELTGTIVLLSESNNLPTVRRRGKPKGVVSKGTRKVPDAVSYRAKVQRQPIYPDKVKSCGWREESPPQDFSFFMAVSQFPISMRSYSSLPTLQGWAAVESIGTTRIRHTQALWTQGVTTNNR